MWLLEMDSSVYRPTSDPAKFGEAVGASEGWKKEKDIQNPDTAENSDVIRIKPGITVHPLIGFRGILQALLL